MNLALILFAWLGLAQASGIAQPEAIYGSDGRRDTANVSDPRLQELARGSVALIDSKSLEARGISTFHLKGKTFGQTFKLCPEVRYHSEPSISYCSGFLVAPDLVVTAGHCLHDQKGCQETAVLFDYHSRTVNSNDVYYCKDLVYGVDSHRDFAFLRLDRPVRGRKPIRIEDYNEPSVGDSLVMIGHPSGLPQKITVGGMVRRTTKYHIKASIDAFEYNSGSPVFERRSMKFAGILVAGEEDFEKDQERQCKVLKVCAQDGCRGEDVMRASYIWDIFKTLP